MARIQNKLLTGTIIVIHLEKEVFVVKDIICHWYFSWEAEGCKSYPNPYPAIIDSIENAFDKNKFTCRVFIDLKKAFDTVDHEILFKKLWHYGITEIAMTGLNLILRCLSNKMQHILINGILCDLKLILEFHKGPLLFLLYINDLHNFVRFPSPFHFANGTGLLNIQESMHAE